MWGTILEIVLKVLGFALDKIGADAETKRAYLSFVGQLEERQLVSAKLRDSYKAQLERLKKGQ